jgi:protein O-mannosyl-transferase
MRKKTFLISCIIILLTTITYLNHFDNPFFFDDFHTIVNNPHIRSLNNIPSYFTDVSTFSYMPTNQGYRPIVTLSLAIDYAIAGELNPFYFHLSMFLGFLIQIVLMILLFKELLKEIIPDNHLHILIFFAVGWYALHTVNAETLNYIISRSDSLSTLFVVAALYIYVKFKTKRKYGLYLIPAILGILTKQTAVMFFAILFVYVLLFEIDASIPELFSIKMIKKLIIKILPAFLICLLFGYIVYTMQRSDAMVETSNFDYMITQPWVLLRYFILFFLPVNLSADPDWQTISNIFDERVIIGFIFIISLIIVAFKTSMNKKTRPISFGLLWFILALLPTSSFIALTQVTNDHRMFFPFVGLVLSVVVGLYLLWQKQDYKFKNKKLLNSLVLLAGVLVLSANAFGTYNRNTVWSSDESLWYDVTVKSPKNSRGMMNYGLTQMQKGNYETALEYFTESLKLYPEYAYAHINMGILKNELGMIEEAEEHYRKGVYYAAIHADPPYYYAKFLKMHNRLQEAITYCKKAVEISPDYLPPQYLLLELYFENSDKNKLIETANKIFEIIPQDATAQEYINKTSEIGMSKLDLALKTVEDSPTADNYLNLSLEYYYQDMYAESIDACYKALDINPNLAIAYNNICSAYNRLKEYDKAIEACNKALEINPNYERAKNNLELAKSKLNNP